jgi:hypothetical protein
LLSDFEDAISSPCSLAFVAPVEKALSEYIQQIGNDLLADCPADLRPVFHTQSCQYRFSNGSVISFAGSNQQSYNNLRGKKFKRASVDEAAFVDNLRELVEGVLTPAVSDSNGFIRLSSTPPDVPDHPFEHYYREAEDDGRAAHFTIYDAGYSAEWIDTWAKEVGGKESATFRREYLAEFVIDEEKLIVPEWRETNIYSQSNESGLRRYFDKYFSLDTGTVDKTVGLFGYYDFPSAALFIEDEVVREGRNWTSLDLANEIREKEALLWGPGAKVYRRVGDSDNQILLADFSALHNLPISATSKDSLVAMVNKVRLWANAGRLKVHERCKLLVKTLKGGHWNNNKDQFARTVLLGHMDALAALVYLVRNVDEHHNPIPPDFGVDHANMYFDRSRAKSDNAHAIQKALVGSNPFMKRPE